MPNKSRITTLAASAKSSVPSVPACRGARRGVGLRRRSATVGRARGTHRRRLHHARRHRLRAHDTARHTHILGGGVLQQRRSDGAAHIPRHVRDVHLHGGRGGARQGSGQHGREEKECGKVRPLPPKTGAQACMLRQIGQIERPPPAIAATRTITPPPPPPCLRLPWVTPSARTRRGSCPALPPRFGACRRDNAQTPRRHAARSGAAAGSGGPCCRCPLSRRRCSHWRSQRPLQRQRARGGGRGGGSPGCCCTPCCSAHGGG